METEAVGKERSLIRRLFGNSSLLTLAHEDAHANFKAMLEKGAVTLDETASFFLGLDQSLTGKADRNGNQLRFIPEGVTAPTFAHLDEAIAEFAEVMLLRTRSGQKTAMRNLLNTNLSAMVKNRTPGASKFRAFVRGMREMFGRALSRKAVIEKAIRDGAIDDSQVEQFRAMLQGTTLQEEFDAEVKAEWKQYEDLQAGVDEDNPFSIGGRNFTSAPPSINQKTPGYNDFFINLEVGTQEWSELNSKWQTALTMEELSDEVIQEYGDADFEDPAVMAEIEGEQDAINFSDSKEGIEEKLQDAYFNAKSSAKAALHEFLAPLGYEVSEGGGNFSSFYFYLSPEADMETWLEENSPDIIENYDLTGKIRFSDHANTSSLHDSPDVNIQPGDDIGVEFERLLDRLPDLSSIQKNRQSGADGNQSLNVAEQQGQTPEKAARPNSAKTESGASSFSIGPAQDAGISFSIAEIGDAEYLGLAKDPKANKPKLQAMVNAVAEAAGLELLLSFNEVAPEYLRTMNGIYKGREAHVESMAREFIQNGYQGRPILKIGDDAITGSHRIIATRRANEIIKDEALDLEYLEVPVYEMEEEFAETFDEWLQEGNNGWLDSYADFAGMSNDDYTRAEIAEEALAEGVVTPEFEALLRAESLSNDGNDYESFKGDIYFSPTQIKSADPVTYDADGNIIPLSKRFDQSTDSISYSIGDSPMRDSLITDASRRAKAPEARIGFFQKIRQNLEAGKRDVARTVRAFGKDATQRAIVDPRTMKSIRKEAAMREAARRDELENEAYAKHQGILEDDTLTKLKQQPVHEYLSDPDSHLKGRLMSRSIAIGKGENFFNPNKQGDYDGSEGVSRSNFGGNMAPDVAAQELFDNGLIREATPDAMWEALNKESENVSRMKEYLAAAKADIKEAKGTAKAEAKAWQEAEIKRQKEDNSLPARIRRHLVMLDAITMALPIEERGRVGGYTALSKLGSDEKALEYLQKKLEKADQVLERYLRKIADKNLKQLFKRASAARRESGKSDKGKIDGITHSFFDVIKQATKSSFEEVEAMVASAQSVVAKGEEVSADKFTLNYMLAETIPQFGNWKELTAAERMSALENGWHIFNEALGEAHAREIEQREHYQEQRAKASSQTGVTVNEATLQKADIDKQRQKPGTKAKNWELEFAGFEGLLEKIFGVKSDLAKSWTEKQREAEAKRSRLRFEAQSKLDTFFADRAGGTLKGMKLAASFLDPIIETSKGIYSEMQLLSMTMAWQQPDGRRHMEGVKDENGKVTSSWSYDQEFIDSVEGEISDTMKDFREFLYDQYEDGYSPLNEVYKKMNLIELPKVSGRYSPLNIDPFMASSNEVDIATGMSAGQAGFSPGLTKRRSQTAVSQPVFIDAFTAFQAHNDATSHYIAFAEFGKEINAILNQRDVVNHVKVKAGHAGKVALSEWNKLFINGGVQSAGSRLSTNKDLLGMFGRLAKMALYLKGSVSLVQSTILGGAIIDMSTPAYFKGMAKLMSGRLDFREAWNSEFIQQRFRDQPVIMQLMRNSDPSKAPNKMQFLVNEFANIGISGTDAFFTAATYSIYTDHYLSEGRQLQLEGEQLRIYAEKKAIKSTERVSQPTRQGTRSIQENLERSPWKMLGYAFASDARMKIALTVHRMRTGTKAEKARALTFFFILNGLGATLLRNMWRDVRSDDDDEIFDGDNWDIKAMMVSTMFGSLNGIPVLGEKIDSAVKIATGERTFTGTLVDGVDSGSRVVRNADDYLNGDIEIDRAIRDAEALLTTAGMFNEKAASAKSIASLLRDLEKLLSNAIGD